MDRIEISGIRDLAKRVLITLREEGPDRLFLYGMRYLSWRIQLHRFVRSFPNPIATAIYLLVRQTVRYTIWILNRIYPHKYTDADPYKTIFVDPSAIERTTGNPFSKRRGWVVDGDWDTNGEVYMQRSPAKAIEQRFTMDHEESDTVPADRYAYFKSRESADSTERLYQNICNRGYKSQHELLKEDPEAAWNGLNDAMHPLANEVAVDIGRNGELLWNICGQHRLAIAKVLEIDRIPVQVFRRHTEWQSIRDRIRRGEEVPETLRDHPDLADVLTKRHTHSEG